MWPMAPTIVCCAFVVRRSVTCPPPPASVSQWLLPDWADPAQAAYFAQQRNAAGTDGAALTIRFDDDAQRAADFEAWSAQRDQWAAEEVAARQALKFFELFYEIHAAIERDGGEQLELVAADGRLSWIAESSIEGMVPIDHPILLKRVELRFDAVAAEFSIHETDRPTEVYSAMLADLQESGGDVAARTHGRDRQRRASSLGGGGHGELPESGRADAFAHERSAAGRRVWRRAFRCAPNLARSDADPAQALGRHRECRRCDHRRHRGAQGVRAGARCRSPGPR